jgi:3-oxoacyl-[acyl-carrier-protein] synthase III
MRYQNVCIESFGYTVPQEIITTDEIERRLEPLYARLRLPAGRLELMTGIRERRFWPRATRPSDVSILSGRNALEAADFEIDRIGALVHGSVCRDHLEPATAARVHHELGLPQQCVVYDVSNACLGLLNGMLQVANMIELGQIEAGLVVGSEGSRQLVETTIDALNRDTTLTRQTVKNAVASLTIGSASCAILLTHKDISHAGNRLTAAAARAHTQHHALCHSGDDEAGVGMSPLMNTDSETLMREGIATGAATFEKFLAESGWSREEIDKTFCHQVGSGHRKLMLESLGLSGDTDFTTLEWLGNTGSAALPITMALGLEQNFAKSGDRLAMLGIGSGINSVMLAVEWQKTLVRGAEYPSIDVKDKAGQRPAPLLLGPHRAPNEAVVKVVN